MTLEQKVNICLEALLTDDTERLRELRELAKQALTSPTCGSRKEQVYMLLNEIGVPRQLLGYYTLAEAIELVSTDSSYLRGFSNRNRGLYAIFADKTCSDIRTVAHNVDHAIRVTFRPGYGNADAINTIFAGVSRGKFGNVVPKKFIETCADVVNRRIKGECSCENT